MAFTGSMLSTHEDVFCPCPVTLHLHSQGNSSVLFISPAVSRAGQKRFCSKSQTPIRQKSDCLHGRVTLKPKSHDQHRQPAISQGKRGFQGHRTHGATQAQARRASHIFLLSVLRSHRTCEPADRRTRTHLPLSMSSGCAGRGSQLPGDERA